MIADLQLSWNYTVRQENRKHFSFVHNFLTHNLVGTKSVQLFVNELSSVLRNSFQLGNNYHTLPTW